MSTQLVSVSDMQSMATAIARSNLFGIKTPDQALALMLIAQAEGMHPAIAARDYHVIQGRPALKSDAMLARFQSAGGKVEWLKYDDKEVSAKFSHPQGGTATITWTIEQARSAGLATKDVWRQYPRQMLRSRVISEGVKTIYPGVAVGVYTPEEIQDFDTKPPTKEVQCEVVSSGTSVESKDEVGVDIPNTTPSPAPISSNETPAAAKKPYFAKIKASGWSKEQLSDYAKEVFGKPDANSLSLAELMKLAKVVNEHKFDEVLNKAPTPKEALDDLLG
jgi:hypothetical protein